MLSLADTGEYYQLILSQGLGVGLGCGLIFSPALSVQAHHWKRRRALAMGVVLSGPLSPSWIFWEAHIAPQAPLAEGSSIP